MATRSIWTTSMVLALVYACTDPALPDAGVMDSGANDAGSDAGVVTCAATSECDDGLFCNGEERCMDAVCVPGAPACGTGECDEGRDSCVCSGNPDRDEDGHDSLACDGDDCDDDDPLRFPGNGEVCDAEGHDEDCDEATVGERDADGDGFIDSACCNGSTCGRDCDDRFRGINPDEMELCNAIDDNCDGRVDEPVAFCPTGMCVANRCASVSWERVIDSVGREDNATGLAVDSAGNVYLGVLLDADADVDADGTLEPAGTHLVSYDASGRVRWAVPTDGSYGMSGTANDASLVLYDQTTLVFRSTVDGSVTSTQTLTPFDRWERVTADRVVRLGDTLVLVATLCVGAGVDPCGTESGLLLVRYGSAGEELSRRVVEAAGAHVTVGTVSSGTSRTHVAINAGTDVSVDWGLGAVPAGSALVVLHSDLSTRWAVSGVGGSAIDVDDSGACAVVGSFTGPWTPPGATAPLSSIGRDGFALMFDSSGSHVWTRVHSGPDDDLFEGVFFGGRGDVLVSGRFSGEMDVAPRGRIGSPTGLEQTFILVAGASDGDRFVSNARVLDGSGYVGHGVMDPFGALVAAGSFLRTFTLPSGGTYDTGGRGSAAFVFRIADF